MEIIGIAGSLRRDTLNKVVLRAATGLAPVGASIAVHDIADVPLYNFDVE